MPPEQNSKDDRVLTEHLQDQFVAWFIGVMAFVFLGLIGAGNQENETGVYHQNNKKEIYL